MRNENPDPKHIPAYLGDPEIVAPCPCGTPPTEDAMVIEGETGLSRWFHQECLDFLKYDMNPEEAREMQEWKRRVLGEDEGDIP